MGMEKEVYDISIKKLKGKKGLHAVAFTDDPAIEVRGFYFSKQRKQITDNDTCEQDILKHLEDKGIDEIPKGWTEISEEDYKKSEEQRFAIIDIGSLGLPQLESVFDVYDTNNNGIWHLRYQYTGPVDFKNRRFCAKIMGMGKTYTYEEISGDLNNSEFGNYSIFDYKGSYGCRHTWKRKFFYEDIDDNETRNVGNIPEVTRNLLGIDDEARTLNANLKTQLSFINTKKMRVCAPALIPDIEIYREDENGEYFVTFSKEEIENLVVDFNSKHIKEAFNLNHDDKAIAPAYILESWLIEDENDKAYSVYNFSKKQVPIGSWMLISQITDKEFFQKEIIENQNFGYSVEGFFDMELKLNKNRAVGLSNKVNYMKIEKLSFEQLLRKQAFKRRIKSKFSEITDDDLNEIVDAIVSDDATTDKEVEAAIENTVDVKKDDKDEPLADDKKKDEPLADDKKKDEPLADDKKKDEPLVDDKKKDEPLVDDKKKDEELEDQGAVVDGNVDDKGGSEMKGYFDDKFSQLVEVIANLEASLKPVDKEAGEGELIPMSTSQKLSRIKNLNK